MAKRPKAKSLASLARLDEPFAHLDELIRRLHAEKVETRLVEWKVTPPFGSSVTTKVKYRIVKAVLSFANTDGGFVVFGVSSKGEWTGLSKMELDATDPAMLTELINGCVAPELGYINYTPFKRAGRWFAVLHTPPSAVVPHVTTKEVVDAPPERKILLPKGAVFCRYGAKCDLATAAQYHRMIEKRTAYLKADLLRRIREVEVPVVAARSAGSSAATSTVARIARASDTSVTPVAVTRNKDEASGVLVYEEIDPALVEDANNILALGKLLSPTGEFVFSDKIYHKIYAERQRVDDTAEHLRLARVAVVKFYAAMNYWVLQLTPSQVADLLQVIPLASKSSNVRMLCRLAVLLGDDVLEWLATGLERAWHDYAQPPAHVWLVKKMKAEMTTDRRVAALQLGEGTGIPIPDQTGTLTVKQLLERPDECATFLSLACMKIVDGHTDWRQHARHFDILAYGSQLATLGSKVARLLPSY